MRPVAAVFVLALGLGACVGHRPQAMPSEPLVFHVCTCPVPCAPEVRFEGFRVWALRVK